MSDDPRRSSRHGPALIEIGKSIFDAIRSAAMGDGEGAYQHAKLAHDRLTLEIAKKVLK